MKQWSLYLDDVRNPADAAEWTVIARSSDEAMLYTKMYGVLPQRASLDHDLGGDDTGMVYLKWIVDAVLDGELQYNVHAEIDYTVHSANPVGRDNMETMIRQMKMNLLVQHVENTLTNLLR